MAVHGLLQVLLIDELNNQEQIIQGRLRQRHLRDASNAFELSNAQFLKLFRLNKHSVIELITALEPHMPETHRSTAIPNHLKVLAALFFFGHGSYQMDVGQGYILGLSQPSVSRCISIVSNVISDHLLNTWIRFPTDEGRKNEKKARFMEKYGFPCTIGAIDCTHIAIIGPPEYHPIYPAPIYYSRKGYYSINLQIIGDADTRILNMNARFPGSTHDSAIWLLSNIREHMMQNFIDGDHSTCIVGDSGYPLQPWLLTPYEEAVEGSREDNFNVAQKRARNCIERLNGILKGRFRCLLKHRTLNYDPLRAANIIYSCGVLHNIAMHFNVELPDDNDENNRDNNNANRHVRNIVPHDDWFAQGITARNNIRDNYFH